MPSTLRLLSRPLYGGLLMAGISLGGSTHADDGAARVVADDPAFHALIDSDAIPERLYGEALWSEGPLALPQGGVIWSDIKSNRVLIWREGEGVSEWLKPAQFHNGHALDQQGRVVAASHGRRGVERREENGEWRLLVDIDGMNKLNSPNDLVVDTNGDIWFTDPTFGIDVPEEGYGGRAVTGGEFVYRFDPQRHELTRLETSMVKTPNGLAFAPGEHILYIADSQQAHDRDDDSLNHHIVAYDVDENGALSGARVFAEVSPGVPDGIKVDEQGNVWSSSDSGIQVFSPAGKRLGRIELPERTANLAFGRGDDRAVYITASASLYRVPVKVDEANR
ncbi:SMP-30/gluconolactonase/LRE family protein [Kushneria aurantia]|uniref:SMP-30/gluconolactonase/LRE family protein n=1 Tax=Kushneria aurantia TaxID=504092 RepID=A0ABV6G7K9_9GAMM|nr:SMP-30/gluconolactonase/LRE family protein [Kushneria aurantia]